MAELIPPQTSPVSQAQEPQAPSKEAIPHPEPKEEKKEAPDQYRRDTMDRSFQAQRMVRQGAELGRKVDFKPTRPPRPQPRVTDPRVTDPRVTDPTIDHYRRLSQERAFSQSPLRDSGLYRHVSEHSLPHRFSQPQSLSRHTLAQLIRMRHAVEDRPNMRLVIRHEIQKWREAGQAEKAQAQQEASPLSETRRSPEGESPFEALVKQMLGGKKVVPDLPSGIQARYASKPGKDWNAFFTNLLGLGNKETSMIRYINQLKEALFRGLYRQMESQQGMTLVSDLLFLINDKVVADKFARILVEHPELLALLEKMAPGDRLPQEWLARLGEELPYIQMTHVPEGMTEQAREAARVAALAQLKSPIDPQALSRMERALAAGRESRVRQQTTFDREQQDTLYRGPLYDPCWERQERFGKPRPWILFGYSVGAIGAGLLLYLLISNFF